ncbi:carbon-nitrogen family hydrolase [Saccharothrix algeriensis]|uniref:Amidohydrolase n=1 Tax=Saccharothrix algeriensis TaxID=173560 RepID=A0A8T8I2Z1_9PSEU|nr:carbon-nitrogen family hydrolase [Saccharothrix algeriensis]MBM7811202.1 putative amidohydrolase [Saccharothrix algeriensis]QTR05116.1 carbon-nitrogen family hydrolase [Saccharothrix algeriensis]
MKIALVQVASPPGEAPDDRRARVGRLVAGARGADLVVLPELWAAGYFAFDDYARRSEPLAGPTVGAARRWAAELGAHVHLGSVVERDGRGRLFNTAVLVAPDGRIAHTYRKVHVFGHASREAELLTPGDALDVADTAFGPLGATTCYDLRFPELWRELVDRGAQTVVVPAAWPAARREHWRLFTSCRAVEQQVLLVACNAVGVQEGVELAGCSRVVDPWGTVLAEAGADEGVTVCEVDPAVVPRVRAGFPVLADRRWGRS